MLVFLITVCAASSAFAGEQGWLGAQVKSLQTQPQKGKLLHLTHGKGNGVFVSEVLEGSPAEQMGLKPNDAVLSVNYRDVNTAAEFADALSALNPGDKVVLLIVRAAGKSIYITGTMGKLPGRAPRGRSSGQIEAGRPSAADISAKIYAPIGHQGIQSLDYSPDGRYIVSAGSKRTSLDLWDISAGRLARTFTGHTERVVSAAFSPDGRYLLSGGFDKTVRLWDVSTGSEIKTFKGHTGLVLTAAFSPDGRYAASGSRDNTIRLWDISSGRQAHVFAEHTDGVSSMAFSADGRYLLSGSFDKTVKLWDIPAGRAIRTLKGHREQVSSVALSPDGRRALSRSGDRITKTWDLNAGREIRTFSADDINSAGVASGSQGIRAGTFSADARLMLTTKFFGGAISLWDIDSGRVIKKFAGHLGMVPAVKFSSDAKRFVSGGDDGAIRLWDIETGGEIAQFISLQDGEWIVLAPEGYYNCSVNAHKYLHIKVGGKVYGIDQFYDVFYRPDIVAAKLRCDDINGLVTLTIDEALRNPPPTVDFDPLTAAADQPRIRVCYHVKSTGGGIGEVRVFHNGKLVQSDGYYREASRTPAVNAGLASLDGRAIHADMRSVSIRIRDGSAPTAGRSKGDSFDDCSEIDAVAGENEISVSAFNGANTVQSYMKTVNFSSGVRPAAPHLYILAVGIDRYADSGVNLKYAVKDARDLGEKIKAQSATLYPPHNIHYSLVMDGDAGKANIINRVNELSAAIRPQDSFIFFAAGHGVLIQNQYYMLTSGFDGRVRETNMISSNEIVEMSKRIKSLSQLFIFDTCHAGGVDTIVSGLYDARMSVLAKKMGLHIYASASDKQAAMDGYRGNGLFTFTLLDGLNNNRQADLYRDGRVTIAGLGEYSKRATTNISREIGHSQTPLIINFGRDSAIYKLQ
jgi:WD40 repeat protein